MSNKTEFKDVIITKISYSKNGEYIFFTVEDTRTFEDVSKVHKFDINAKANVLEGIELGNRIIIDASLVYKEYEYKGEIKRSWSIWAQKVYPLKDIHPKAETWSTWKNISPSASVSPTTTSNKTSENILMPDDDIPF